MHIVYTFIHYNNFCITFFNWIVQLEEKFVSPETNVNFINTVATVCLYNLSNLLNLKNNEQNKIYALQLQLLLKR